MTEDLAQNPVLLRIYLYSRSIMAILLFVMYYSGSAPNILGVHSGPLFFWASIAYTCACLISLAFFSTQQLQSSENLISGLLIIDLIAILTLVHASGGTESGLGYLLLITVAISGIFIRGQMALAFAAMASLFVIGQSIYFSQNISSSNSTLFSAGTLGILIFITAISFQYLTAKIRISDIKAEAQTRYAQELQNLAQQIIARMRTGIIVIGSDNRIQLINDSALQFLGLDKDQDYLGLLLDKLCNLAKPLDQWREGHSINETRNHAFHAGDEVRIGFTALDTSDQPRAILFLEDNRALVQQAQQMKLASLGRLTASIAHEVRNPLGAISHAAQLLSESEKLDPSDTRLTEIILQHSDRVNQIIENTLVLSRRKAPKPEVLKLNQWLNKFVEEYRASQDAELVLIHQSDNLKAKIDPVQLGQVLTNLVDNGCRHSEQKIGVRKVTILASVNSRNGSAYIEVTDEGSGVPEDKVQQIFDPFYTTEASGSGLGLYISKELCEINQANLDYKRTEEEKSCFRIDFSHHLRVF